MAETTTKTATDFKVFTYTPITDETPMWCHWSTGLTMHISKNGVEMTLTPDEIQQLVRSLPRTFGGKY